jgi:hypothetical protein
MAVRAYSVFALPRGAAATDPPRGRGTVVCGARVPS